LHLAKLALGHQQTRAESLVCWLLSHAE
jgi:hypothetical protein